MRDTIKSSWEFVDYVFSIEGVSRAFTHQLVRTRAGSYAQESQRTVDVSENEIVTPDLGGKKLEFFLGSVELAQANYSKLLSLGVPVQDARGVLPQAIATSIVAKYNLRTLSDMAKVRLCVRTQGEYQDVFRAMREEVIRVHPWAEEFIEVHCVAEGTCAFPRYGRQQCPVYYPRMDLTALKLDTKKKFWSVRHVAVPVAKAGRTM
jgi:flavin-dependent thymidylate synthase